MSRYLKSQQKLIDAAFAGVRPAPLPRGAAPQPGVKRGTRKASARRTAAR